MEEYDVAILGAGPAGIFCAYELMLRCPTASLVLVDAGGDLCERCCPIHEGRVSTCANCSPCHIMRGFGGAGAYSDGKFNLTTAFGGWLHEYLPEDEVMALIEYVDQLNLHFGAPQECFDTADTDIGRRALAYDLHLLDARVRHIGTENNLKILTTLREQLGKAMDILFRTAVTHIEPTAQGFALELARGDRLACRYLVAAPGRAGAEWFSQECQRLGLTLDNNQVDVGVRVELPADVYADITEQIYEAKLVYRTKQYGDLVRTFCMNPYGYVVAENTDGIITVNGHSFRERRRRSSNTNFALLVSNKLTHPFKEPHQYGKRIASFSNMLGGGVLVQRFGDLLKGRRSNEHRMAQSFTQPTLAATAGDLSLVLPKRHLDNIIEMITALDMLAPGTANHDTLLYGVEVKFYSSRLELDCHLETKHPNLFAVGDGAGITRGLSQASASGVHAARVITERLEA